MLTILVYLICLNFNIFYAIGFINRLNPQVCYYNRYIEDTGEFPVNASGMFNFIQILNTNNNHPDIIDFDILNIIGIGETINLYQQDNDLSKYNHWIYGPCNNSTDLKGLEELITFDNFTGSACISKYYNKEDKKYYNINDNNFIWPIISHSSHYKRSFFGIIVEKCRNATLNHLGGKFCKSKEEIIKYIKEKSVKLQLIDQYIDILDYKNPYSKYFHSISNGFFEESFTTNHLNFNPSKIISDEGIFIENKKETISYILDLNEKTTSSSGDSGILVAFYFWMKNRMQYYERVYQKFQFFLSDVGGLCSIVLTIAELINYVVNQYIILFDMKDYMKEIENSKEYSQNIFKIKNNNNFQKLFPPKKTIQNEKDKKKGKEKQKEKDNENEDNSNKVRILKNDIDIYSKKNNVIKKKKKKKTTFCLNEKNTLNKKTKPLYSFTHKNSKGILKSKNDQSNYYLRDLNKAQTFIETIETKTRKSKYEKLNFIHYLAYLMRFAKYHPYIKIYSDFRIQMISEENLIINNLNIDKLLRKSRDANNSLNQDLEIPRTNLNND